MRSRSPSLLYFAMFVIGLASLSLSVLMPRLVPQTPAGDAHAGRLLAIQFLGSLTGALLVTRRPTRSLALGLLLCSLFGIVLGLAHAGFEPLLLGYGLGLGLSTTATNIIAGLESSPQQRASRLEVLNFFWPLGAATCPWLLTSVRGATPMRPYLAVGTALVLLLGFVLLRNREERTQWGPELSAPSCRNGKELLLCCLLALLSVGVETSLGGWLSSFATRYVHSYVAVALVPSLFWVGILSGRLVASVCVRHVSPFHFAAATSLFAASAAAMLARTETSMALCVLSFLCALAVSSLFPIVLGRAVELRGKNLVFFSAGIGSALTPWLVGKASASTGSLRLGLAVPALAALLLAGAFVLMSRDQEKAIQVVTASCS